MLNDHLNRVIVGRDKDVPVETLTSLWFLFYDKKGRWDSATMSQYREFLELLDTKTNFETEIDKVFAVWHGQYRTNLFLMDKEDLVKRFRKMKGGLEHG